MARARFYVLSRLGASMNITVLKNCIGIGILHIELAVPEGFILMLIRQVKVEYFI